MNRLTGTVRVKNGTDGRVIVKPDAGPMALIEITEAGKRKEGVSAPAYNARVELMWTGKEGTIHYEDGGSDHVMVMLTDIPRDTPLENLKSMVS